MIIMSNSKKQIAPLEYSFDMLLNDILSHGEESDGMGGACDKAEREFLSKRIVMQMLIILAQKYEADAYNDEMKLRNAIGDDVDRDELLSGYAFFVPQNPQFNYTWNYMRKRKKSYIEFLVRAVVFLKDVLSDINILASKSAVGENLHIVFSDIIDVAFIAKSPHIRIEVLWENFNRIATIKRHYNVVAKTRESLLVSRERKNADDVNKLMEEALRIAGITI